MGFILRLPKDTKIGSKIPYASRKVDAKRNFTGVSAEFEAKELGDLDYMTLMEKVNRKIMK